MKNIKNYRIQNARLKVIVFGSKAKSFKNKLEEIEKFIVYEYDNN